MMTSICFTLNGRDISVDCDPIRRLLDVLRDDLAQTGTKEGCGEGECGACAVLVDNRLTNSCVTAIQTVAGRQVTTIEGLAGTRSYAVLAQCFSEAGAVQCGFCTPGMILAAEALLRQNPHPDEQAVREAISGNLCRCTGYNMIVEAVLAAAERGEGLW